MRRPLFTFFPLVYLVAWCFWAAAAAVSGGVLAADRPQPVLSVVLLYLGTFTPAFVALWLTMRAEGGAGVRVLLARLFQWDVGVRWYLFAIGFMAAIKLTAALVHRVATGAWPMFGQDAWYLMLAATIFSTVIGGQTGEEIGWRGFALPRMAAQMGLGPASLLLGAIWACWHLPLFFIPGTDSAGQSFPLYFLSVVAISVVIAWLWARTNGSLLLTMLLHSAINNTKDIVPSAVEGATDSLALSTSKMAWITVALLWVCAGYFLTRMRSLVVPPSPEIPVRVRAG